MRSVFLTLAFLLAVTVVHGQKDRKSVLKVSNWADYIDDRCIADFEKWYQEQTGEEVHVEYQTFEIPEDVLEEIETKHVDIDVFCPSDYMVERMFRRGLLQKIDTSYAATGTPNWLGSVSPFVDGHLQQLAPEGVRMKDYAVGYKWGTMGVLYNTRYAERNDVDNWEFLLNPKFRGKVYLKDSFFDIYTVLIAYAYYDDILSGKTTHDKLVSEMSDEHIRVVEDILNRARPQIASWEVDNGKEYMSQGNGWLDVTWSGDAQWAVNHAREGVSLNYVIPKEGSEIWFDAWVIPSYAKNRRAASYWINYLSNPEVALRSMRQTGYCTTIGTPEMLAEIIDENEADVVDLSYFFGDEAKAVHANSIMFPDRGIIERCSMLRDIDERQDALLAMWNQVKEDRDSTCLYIVIGSLVLLLILVYLWRTRRQRANSMKIKV